MSKSKWLSLLLATGMAPSFATTLSACSDAKTEAVSKVVTQYCEAEFNGVVDIRQAVVEYTPTRKAREKARDPELEGKVIALDADPIIVVESYRVNQVRVSGDRATATVLYRRLAATQGEGLPGRKLRKDCRRRDTVKLVLQHIKSRWYIIDPPAPRTSQRALIEYYQDSIHRVEEWINAPRTSTAQKQFYRLQKEALKFLESLDCAEQE